MAAYDVLTDGLELGYIRLWRKIKGSAILRDPHLLQLWIWILVKAAWGPRTVSIVTGRGRTLVHLQPGQFVFGRKSASDELGQPPETLRDRMMRLKSHRMVAIQPAAHYSVVTVVNWASYQGEAGKDATQPAGQPATQPPPNRHKEELKHLRSREKEGISLTDRRGKGNGEDLPSPKLKVRRKKEPSPEVLRIYGYYCEVIANIPAKKADALRNIQARLREGFTEQRLGEAIARYATECFEKQTPEDRRYHSNNFFGQKGYFTGFLPETDAAVEEGEAHE